MQHCPSCHRKMVWSGTGGNRLLCPECDLGIGEHPEEEKEETITDLKRAGKCYCHLMEKRICEVCRRKGKS